MVSILDIIERVKGYQKDAEEDMIKRAYIFASYYHKNQVRASGEPYLTHPLRVAEIITQLKGDDKMIAAALLHDVVEDTKATIEDIKKTFSDEIAFLVDGVTKLSSIEVKGEDERQLENFRKMFIFMAKDIRVILIKLADRLDNLRTIEYLPEEKRRKIAEETLNIFAPIAHRLGIYWLKTQLEDKSFEILYPDIAQEIKENLAKISPEKTVIKKIEEKLKNILIKEGFKDFQVSGRIKGIYSIWRKILRDGVGIKDIYDIVGFRIIVPTVKDCYAVLGVIHSYFKPIPGRFKDYIAMPKINGYKSLHTSVIMEDGQKAEIQIRTYEMHKEAEEGIAAHWIYKGPYLSEKGIKIFSWLRSIIKQEDMKDIKENLFPDEIYVFTPKGDVKILPQGATVLDFAYSVHTEIGHQCIGAKVNGRIQPIDYKLQNGDTVEILTSKKQKPSKTWLNIVITPKAKERIKTFIKKEEEKIFYEIGEENLKKDLRREGFHIEEIIKDEILSKVMESLNIKNLKDLFLKIGYGKISTNTIIKFIRKTIGEKGGDEIKIKKEEKEEIEEKVEAVKGDLKNVKMRIAECCSPVLGDSVVGFITKGYGIVIHREDCYQLKFLDKERIIKVSMEDFSPESFLGNIKIITEKKMDIVQNIISLIQKYGFSIKEMKTYFEDLRISANIKVKVKDKGDLEKIINSLSSLKGVIYAGR